VIVGTPAREHVVEHLPGRLPIVLVSDLDRAKLGQLPGGVADPMRLLANAGRVL
jgi:hypothetical protein